MSTERNIAAAIEAIPGIDVRHGKEMRGELSATIITEPSEFASIRIVWNELAGCSPSASIFQSHEWLSLWWKHFSLPNDQLFVILVYDEQRLVGAAPCCFRTARFLGKAIQRKLMLIGSGEAFGKSFGFFLDDGPSDFLDFIALPGYETVVCNEFLEHTHTEYDCLEFLNIPENGIVRSYLVPMMTAQGIQAQISQADMCPYLTVPDSMESYLQSIAPGTRRKFSRLARTIEQEKLFSIHSALTTHDAQELLEYLINMHQHRWNRMGYPGLFAKPHFSAFFRELIGILFDQGQLWCKAIRSHGSTVAARIAFRSNNTLYDYLSGFDDQSQLVKHRPGFALLANMFDEAIQRNEREINFLRGDEPYKLELTSTVRHNTNIVVTRNEYARSLRYKTWKYVALLAYCRFLFHREWNLIKVQLGQHPVYSFFYHYVKFRFPRLSSKFKRTSSMANSRPENENHS